MVGRVALRLRAAGAIPTMGYGYGYGAYPAYGYGAVAAPVYVQEDPAPAYAPQVQPPAANNYWYYCADPAGYYPYVKNCNKTWMQVVPQTNPGTPPARLVQ